MNPQPSSGYRTPWQPEMKGIVLVKTFLLVFKDGSSISQELERAELVWIQHKRLTLR